MPLLDHFHGPLTRRLQWVSLHHAWCVAVAADLNRRLPRGFSAHPHMTHGIEIDVAALQIPRDRGVDPEPWSPGPPTATLPVAVGTDHFEVLVENRFADVPLAAAIELVSPGNKDRDSARDAFAGKCVGYLSRGAGLLIVDVVTNRRANLHDDLAARLDPAAPPWGAELYAAAIRPTSGRPPTERGERVHGVGVAEFWRNELAVGAELPKVPLWLLNGPCVAVDLEATYRRALDDLGIDAAAG